MKRVVLLSTLLTLTTVSIGCAIDDESPTIEDEATSEPAEEAGTTEQAIFGSNTCKGVNITIENDRVRNGVPTSIEIHRVEYFSVQDDNWHTEQLEDRQIPYPWATGWKEDLQYVEGELITKWRAYYKYFDGGWSDVVWQEIDTTDRYCEEDANYSLRVR